MSEAADRRIAELEQRVKELGWENANLRKACDMERKISKELHDRDLAHIESLRKQMVQRDVYEAEARLPPEHAVLIKHLATVERCITEGPVTYHYAEESDCSFCGEWQGHTRDCAWFAMQFERGVTSVIDDIHAVALQEHERRERQRMPLAGHSHRQDPTTVERMNQILRDLWPPDRQFGNLANDMRDAARYGFGNMRVEVNPLVPPGTAYLTNLSDFQGIPALRQEPAPVILTPEERYEDSGGVAGSAPSAVAPPDDEDVP